MDTNTGKANVQTQEAVLLSYLTEHGSVTRAEAFSRLHIANSPEIIRRLRKDGHIITGTWIGKRNRSGEKIRYKRYILIPETETKGGADNV